MSPLSLLRPGLEQMNPSKSSLLFGPARFAETLARVQCDSDQTVTMRHQHALGGCPNLQQMGGAGGFPDFLSLGREGLAAASLYHISQAPLQNTDLA